MFNLFKKDTPSVGSVLFRGTLPGRPEEFSFLERSGIRITPGKPAPETYWSLKLDHPEWGAADMLALRHAPPPPRALIDMTVSLTPEEKTEAAAADHGVTLRADARRRNILRDRKNFLRFTRAVMADDGLAVVDHVSQLFWSRATLDDELAHDADLDIEAVHCLHAVSSDQDPEKPQWLHSHGLAELGAFDFDILLPHEDLMGNAADGLRAIAFAIVEGELQRNTPRFALAQPGGDIRMVPVGEFNKKAPPGQRALRHADDEAHNPPKGPPRAVVCEPVGLVGGLLGANVRMSRFLTQPIDERSVLYFSTAASDLMAERARNTLTMFRTLSEEFADLKLPCLVKLGYPTEGGGPEAREHIWFEVHAIHADTIDATCINQPFRVPSLRQGQRATHPAEYLSDWTIMTPLGRITPRSPRVARLVRRHRDEVARIIREAAGNGDQE
ncbi:MAG: DUF2314 domain-containing protein [Phycisphaerales bacterium]